MLSFTVASTVNPEFFATTHPPCDMVDYTYDVTFENKHFGGRRGGVDVAYQSMGYCGTPTSGSLDHESANTKQILLLTTH